MDEVEVEAFYDNGVAMVRYPDGSAYRLADVMRSAYPDMGFDDATGAVMASMPPRPDAPDSGVVTPNAGWDWSTGAGRNAIKDKANAAVESLIPPNLRGLFSMLADVNPVRDMEQAGTAARGLFSPDASGMERVGFLGDMLSNMAPTLGPVAAAKAGTPVTNAIMEGLLGWAPGVDDAIARGLADESGALRLGGRSPAQEVADLLASGRAADDVATLPPASNAQLTQITGTFPTYQKAVGIFDTVAPEGRTLDYGAGRGMSAGLGFDTYEPFPQKGFSPTYLTPSAIPDEYYDRLTNFNVLNVVPREVRDSIVEDIGRVIRPGGTGLITTRGRDVMPAKGLLGPEAMSVITRPGTPHSTYQKGFTQLELQEYLRHILGDRFEVSPLRLGPAGAMIKKARHAQTQGPR